MTQQRRTSGRRFYGIAEIAEALGVDRQLATVWRRRSSHGMPRPDDELAAGPLWLAGTIEPWIRATRARLDAEAAGTGATPELLRATTRRVLRLTALLLEEVHRPAEIRVAVEALESLAPQLSRLSGDSETTRRVLREVSEYAGDLGSSPALDANPARPVPDELVIRCLRLVPQLVKTVSRTDTD